MKILGYEIGKTYFDSYWRENHTIINGGLDENGFYWVQSLWLKDNHVTTHCTPRSSKDYEVHDARL